MKTKREDVRNIAIIAHVDHGKENSGDDAHRGHTRSHPEHDG